MILEAEQSFSLTHPQGQAAALAFVRDPALALSRVRFLRGLVGHAQGVRGELIVPVPVLGEVDLPFSSLLQETPDGATLTPQPITGERAWVEVSGQAAADSAGLISFGFHFVAHLATPEAEGWGGAAFEKMVRAAAGRTLERVARELPQGIAAALAAQAEAG
ncbi:DUF3809 domain-containing protein [Deinococcus oregonensis]|uniref:DUF3809 domain-containing protein n=1 Tax=Deinococcus oregonensis TaxID=1805970 RepID=A0ABV6B1M6_9DEIO